MSNYFKYNKLIINLDKNETLTLFGTAKRLELNPKQLELYYDQTKINVTKTYIALRFKISAKISIKRIRKLPLL